MLAQILHVPAALGLFCEVSPFQVALEPAGAGHGLGNDHESPGEFGADLFHAKHAPLEVISNALPESFGRFIGRQEKKQKIHRWLGFHRMPYEGPIYSDKDSQRCDANDDIPSQDFDSGTERLKSSRDPIAQRMPKIT
jgi:hypothetical protein